LDHGTDLILASFAIAFGKNCPEAAKEQNIRPCNSSTMAGFTFSIGPAIQLFSPYLH